VRALWDKNTRAKVRERDRLRGRRPALFGGESRSGGQMMPLPPANFEQIAGPWADTVRKAARQRDEILRLVESLPKRERDQIADVPGTAIALYQRVEGIALNLAELDRSGAPASAEAVEQEITRLESQANPLDRDASEERIRRLAYLKRQRRAVADSEKRRAQLTA